MSDKQMEKLSLEIRGLMLAVLVDGGITDRHMRAVDAIQNRVKRIESNAYQRGGRDARKIDAQRSA